MPLFRPPDIEKLKAKGDVPGLIKVLGYQKDAYGVMRRAAAETLGQIGDPRAVEPLIAALRDDGVRMAAIEALGQIRDPRAVEPLAAALNDREYSCREAAAEALGKIGDPRAIEPLVAALRHTASPAAAALAQIGDPRVVEPLIAALGDKDRDVRKVAATVLGSIGDARAVEPLIAALSEIFLRETAARALGQIGDTRAVEPLVAVLEDHGGYAAEALGRIGDARAVEPLLAALEDDDWDVRRDAARGLVIMHGTARIGEAQRAAILSRRTVFTSPRTQRFEHIDSGYKDKCVVDSHTDYDRHFDEGFGVEFS